jgi:hypothetical protein
MHTHHADLRNSDDISTDAAPNDLTLLHPNFKTNPQYSRPTLFKIMTQRIAAKNFALAENTFITKYGNTMSNGPS